MVNVLALQEWKPMHPVVLALFLLIGESHGGLGMACVGVEYVHMGKCQMSARKVPV